LASFAIEVGEKPHASKHKTCCALAGISPGLGTSTSIVVGRKEKSPASSFSPVSIVSGMEKTVTHNAIQVKRKESERRHAMKEAQSTRIINHLYHKGPLTPMKALKLFGCFRLGARIWDLKREGWGIKSRTVVDKKTKKHFSEYYFPR